MDKVKAWGSIVVTVLVFIIVFWVLYYVLINLDSDPEKDSDGNITKDVFQRSKDLLIVVLPLATAAVGYWFGSDGKEKAEEQAAEAHAEAARVEAQKAAVLAVAPSDTLTEAKTQHGEAFQ